MKIIKYNIATAVSNGLTHDIGFNEILTPVEMPWNKENEDAARAEAKDGLIEIVDNWLPDPEEVPDRLDQVEAQIVYTAMMTGTLIDGGSK